MEWREILDVECVTHEVLGRRDVDDVCVVLDALKDLEGTISAWLELGVSFMGKSIIAQMNPYKVTFLEDAWFFLLVDIGGVAKDMCFNSLPGVVVEALHVAGALGDVHVDALM
jgi:hypothetical protein